MQGHKPKQMKLKPSLGAFLLSSQEMDQAMAPGAHTWSMWLDIYRGRCCQGWESSGLYCHLRIFV